MIVERRPSACPRCRGAFIRAEQMADFGVGYLVLTCLAGHTVQVGQPPVLRLSRPDDPHAKVWKTCPICRHEFLARAEQKHCSPRCQATSGARTRRPTRGAPTPSGGPRTPHLPYASKRGSYRWG